MNFSNNNNNNESNNDDISESLDQQLLNSMVKKSKKNFNIYDKVVYREITNLSKKQERDLLHYSNLRMPSLLKQKKEFKHWKNYNKIFASYWLNNDIVLAGTKDNKLLAWNTEKDSCFNITLPDYESNNKSNHNCGIHSITTNGYLKTQLATGSRNPCDFVIYDLLTLKPMLLLEGHKDWIFGAEYISENIIVTASRDKTIKLWSTNFKQSQPISFDSYDYVDTFEHKSIFEANGGEIKKPLFSRQEHKEKVRDICFNSSNNDILTLSADTTVKIWDVNNFDVKSSVELLHEKELVCLAINEDLQIAAIGSLRHTQLIDLRSSTIIKSVPNMEQYGVRSVCFKENIMSIGSGKGYLSFYDISAENWIPVTEESNHILPQPSWIKKYQNEFQLPDNLIASAIYTHNWDPSGNKLFVGGGPLLSGIKGCYGSIYVY
eukprot:TRINITY_DN634_c1_g1_i1.p1 TRINITY_DN634_c1_g1~~TRINITY_DN634_c1_g1_i1.p1  ORF type:complete len:434 (-),score=87.15 TRINITY_DN634_c1_g1_i1:45-1346(-)